MSGTTRFDQLKKGPLPDYTDYAYKEAVSRLRSMMTDTFLPPHSKHSSRYVPVSKGDDSDEESGVSITVSDTTRVAQFKKPPSYQTNGVGAPKHTTPGLLPMAPLNASNIAAPPEMMGFIQRQEEYIEQLEKESQYCRDELSQLVGKVKDLITENEGLRAQHKNGPSKHSIPGGYSEQRDFEGEEKRLKYLHLEGPNIVFESRISELEAQLTQARLEVKKAQEDANELKRKMLDNDPSSSSSEFYRQLEQLHREKRELSDTLNRLQTSTAQIKERESDASRKVLRTQDIAEKAQMDRQQAELEVQRLKSELELQHERLLDVLSDQTRKVGEERSHAERRYLQHVEQLNTELAMQRDAATKLQLELERHQRMEEDLRRDLSAKTATIDNVRKELSTKIASMQMELTKVLTERDSFEQELNGSRMSGERTELASKQESSRLQVEVNALRQRITKTDNEVMQARRDNMRLSEQIAAQDKEITLYKIKIGEMELNDDGTPKKSDSVRELEALVEKQSQAMGLITQQCQTLAQRLEDATIHHQQEMAELQNNLEFLTGRLENSISSRQWQEGAVTDNLEEHYPQQPVTYEEHNIEEPQTHNQEPAPYHQPEERQPSPSPFQPQLHTLPESTIEGAPAPVFPTRPDSRSGMADNTNPVLSRSSSRGDRSESPLVRKESRKSPLQRRESRLQMQQRTTPPEYASPIQQETDYPPTYSDNQYQSGLNDQPHLNDQNKYQQDYRDSEPYQQPYQSQEQYQPTEMGYNVQETNDSHDRYQPEDNVPQYDDTEHYGGNIQQEGYATRIEPYAQSQDNYRQDAEILRNRTPSRESLRSSHQGNPQGYQGQEQLRKSSPEGYMTSDKTQVRGGGSPLGYQGQLEQTGQRSTSSNESVGPQTKFPNKQENYDSNQHYQQPSQNSPDQGRRQISSEYSDEGQQLQQPQRQQVNAAYEPPTTDVKPAENQRLRQGPTLRKEPSANSARPQQKPQNKNVPTKFQS